MAKLFGYAAENIANKVVKKRGTLIVPPEWFIVMILKVYLKQVNSSMLQNGRKMLSKA